MAGRVEQLAGGVKLSTRLPDGTIEEGVWDINPLDERGPLVGIRILDMRSFVQTQDPKSYVVIKLKSRWEYAGYPPSHASLVPDEYIATGNEPLELSWCMYDAKYVDIGTCVADEDANTIQAFTRTKDGIIREGIWEENVSGKPTMQIVTPWPFGIDKLEDRSYEFIIDSINSTPSHGEFSPTYQVNHSHTKTLPVRIYCAVDGDANSNRGPQTFDLVGSRIETLVLDTLPNGTKDFVPLDIKSSSKPTFDLPQPAPCKLCTAVSVTSSVEMGVSLRPTIQSGLSRSIAVIRAPISIKTGA